MVAYDSPASGRRAKEVLHRLMAELDDDLTFDVRLWRFDLLDVAQAYQDAHADATVAELFVVAFAGNSSPKEGLERLVQNWTEEHRMGDAALVVMPVDLETDGDLMHFLRQAAERNGVRFLFSGDGRISLADTIDLPRLDQPKRHSPVAVAAGVDVLQGGRRFGINE